MMKTITRQMCQKLNVYNFTLSLGASKYSIYTKTATESLYLNEYILDTQLITQLKNKQTCNTQYRNEFHFEKEQQNQAF